MSVKTLYRWSRIVEASDFEPRLILRSALIDFDADLTDQRGDNLRSYDPGPTPGGAAWPPQVIFMRKLYSVIAFTGTWSPIEVAPGELGGILVYLQPIPGITRIINTSEAYVTVNVGLKILGHNNGEFRGGYGFGSPITIAPGDKNVFWIKDRFGSMEALPI